MIKVILVLLLAIGTPVIAKEPAKGISDANQLTAKTWLVANEDRVLDGIETNVPRPIASITKLFTVLTIMESHKDLTSQYISYDKSLRVTREELIEMALVRSDNKAADLLCKTYVGGYNKCISDMNSNAVKWGLTNTTLTDSTGLDSGNMSTAEDLLKLLKIAEQNYMVVRASSKSKVEIKVKKRWFTFNQTNPLISGKKYDFVVSKTGTTSAAGGCIVLTVQTDKGLRRVIVLGSKNGRTRIPEAEFIFKNVS